MELAEVYRVTYEGPDDKLRGIIVCKDEVNGYQYLFKDVDNMEDEDINITMLKLDTFEAYKDADKQLQLSSKPLLTSFDHILPNAYIKSSIRAKDGFSISFYLFGSVYENLTLKYPIRPEKLSTARSKYFTSGDGFRQFTVMYSIFENAVEAHVMVTLTNKSHQFDLYGVIAARTSAIKLPAYSSIIFCKRHAEKIKVGSRDNMIIPLSRDVIAVPLGHKLILQFGLNGCDNDEMSEAQSDRIVETIVKFDATEQGAITHHIRCSKVELSVQVIWCSAREKLENPVEAEANGGKEF